MKLKKKYILPIVLALVILVPKSADAQENLTQQVYAIFQQSCLNCHGEHGAYTEQLIIEHTALVAPGGAIIPGNPQASEFYQRLIETAVEKRMPLNTPPLTQAAIDTIRDWIAAGAPDWRDTFESEGSFITPKEMLETIENHVNSLPPFDRTFARYFTLTHLYNAGETTEALLAYRRALSKLVNSLSWGRKVTNPRPIDLEGTIFYIDLRDYEWEIGTNRWTLIEAEYPYKIEFDAPPQSTLREKLMNLREAMHCEVPFVHVDWFLATASLPPLYHDLLDLPQTDQELEARLEVNVVENIRNAAGKRVWRAGFNDSGVSGHNRVLERHESRYGAYWKSYDFAGSVGSQNIFTHPLSFVHDGGEIVFNLPNGLQAYLLVDAGGNRLNAAPISIVSNPAASDPTVRNGLSCIGCHTEGMKAFEDEVRAVVDQNPNPPFNKDRALRLYTEQARMDVLVAEDTGRYREALEEAGGVFGGIEPIQRFYEAFQRSLDASHAAAAVGSETADFLEKIRENASLKNLGLAVLTGGSGTVKRDTWTSNFSEIVATLNSPDSGIIKPVVPQKERIPGTSVYIPDANLRIIITETLGKAPNASITVEEMEGLAGLDAHHRDIENLAGLELATNLTYLIINNNKISDLSPIVGLINLRRIRLSDNFISDLSVLSKFTALKEVEIGGELTPDLLPLAGLINLEKVEVTNTSISDLSPLAGLTKLKHLVLVHNPISDLSPLAGLTNLETLEMLYAESLDLTPLKGLTGLKKLSAARSGVSDVSPLAGLINLESLALFDNRNIQDVSPLAALRNLKVLNLSGNNISDVSPLAALPNLERLEIQQNNISDISPLDAIRAKTKVFWYENPGFSQGGLKIEGPWLWVMLPGENFQDNNIDLLAQVSGGTVTELKIATNGATEGTPVGSSMWTSHRIFPHDNNIHELVDSLGWGNVERENGFIEGYNVYGSIRLYSQRDQQTKMFVGTDDGVKIWLNGQLVHTDVKRKWVPRAVDYKESFPVTLKAGVNVLLVAVDNHWGHWTGLFGFAADAEYTVISPGTGFAISTDATNVRVGDTFTVHVNAEKVTDLAGWQFDLTFNPDVLEVVEVNEGDFLKTDGETTFFQQGTVYNAAGKIAGLSSALISKGGVTGTGTLLSVVFSAKADGNSRLALHNFQLGSSTGDIIPAGVSDLIISVESKPKWDVNADGQVSVLDLILVAQRLGETATANSKFDVNDDGVISILDLILVARHLGESTTAASPSILAIDDVDELDPAMIQTWIAHAEIEDDGSVAFQQGIANLQRLLVLLIPDETVLLPNYPNPFNPETWIPYHLANSSAVTITIYDMRGTVVRHLDLGHQGAGYYTSRSRAAYWDGRNAVGERVASGVYFYQLQADNLSLLRKMVIVK